MPISWRPAMAIGDASVDADHQRLIELINGVEANLQSSEGGAELAAGLDALAAYAKEHFGREESLMRHTGYKGLAHHRQAHRDLRDELERLRAAIETAKAEGVGEEQTQKVVELLRSWLLDHVFKVDMLLKAFLQKIA